MNRSTTGLALVVAAAATGLMIVGSSVVSSDAVPTGPEPMGDLPWMEPGIPMVERLRKIADDRDHHFKYFHLDENIANCEKLLAAEKWPEKQVGLLMRMTIAQLELGRTLDALGSLDRAQAILTRARTPEGSPLSQKFLWMKGIASLRQGEQDNCVGNHTAESCLLPIRGGGIYKEKRGPRAAVEAYERYLSNDPENVAARWLLNIAYQTLGEWPDGVPSRWLIPPSVLKGSTEVAHFTNVAPALGLDVVSHAGGAIMEDFDGDGYLDIMASSFMFEDQLHYFRNNGDGTFTEQTGQAGLIGELGGLNLIHADYDNDGLADVYVIRGAWQRRYGRHPDSLLHNEGVDPSTGSVVFRDVTEEAGVLDFSPSQTAAFGDYDNDGLLDLFVGNETADRDRFPCLLFHNDGPDPRTGKTTFTEVGEAVGLRHYGFLKGAVWGDYNNDGLQDLYLSQVGEPNHLFRNDGRRSDLPGGWSFTDVTAEAGVERPISSLSTLWFDYDNDGWLDLLSPSRTVDAAAQVTDDSTDPVTQIVRHMLGQPHNLESPCLYRNNHDGTFSDVTAEAGLDRPIYGMGLNFGDLDNDGWLDFYVGTGNPNLTALVPNLMFRNDGNGHFQDVTYAGGFGHLQKGHAFAWGDIDNDGDQDIYDEQGAAWPGDVASNALYLNPGNGNHWTTLKLRGVVSNRDGIGARVSVVVDRPDGSTRSIHVTGGTGGSFGSSSLQQEIGLGDASGIRRIEIYWPASAQTQVITGVPMESVLSIREGDVEARPVESRKVPIGISGALAVCHHHAPVVE